MVKNTILLKLGAYIILPLVGFCLYQFYAYENRYYLIFTLVYMIAIHIISIRQILLLNKNICLYKQEIQDIKNLFSEEIKKKINQ